MKGTVTTPLQNTWSSNRTVIRVGEAYFQVSNLVQGEFVICILGDNHHL